MDAYMEWQSWRTVATDASEFKGKNGLSNGISNQVAAFFLLGAERQAAARYNHLFYQGWRWRLLFPSRVPSSPLAPASVSLQEFT